MFQSLAHSPRGEWERQRRRWPTPTAAAITSPPLLLAGRPPVVISSRHEQDAAALRVLRHSSSSGSTGGLGLRRRGQAQVLLALKGMQELPQGQEEEETGMDASMSPSYPSSFLSASSTAQPRTPAPTPTRVLALSAHTSSIPSNVDAALHRTAQKARTQVEKTVQQVRRAFRPKRPYLADMKEPFHHFRTPDLVTCVLRATLQASLLPMHRFLDELLERIQEAEKRAAILDALDEDEELDEEEEEALLRIEIPEWRCHFRNFEWRVLVNVARSLGTKTIHYTLLDPLLAMYLSTRAMDRLTKDPFLSAKRKDARLASRLHAALRMPKTAAFATVTLSLSNLIWDLLVLGYDLLIDAYPHLRVGPPAPLLPPPRGGDKSPPASPSPPSSDEQRRKRGGERGGPRRRLFWGSASGSPYEGVSDEEEEEGEGDVMDEGFVTRITGGAISLEALAGARGREEEEEFGHFNHASESGAAERRSQEGVEGEEDKDEAARQARRRAMVRSRVRSILLVNGTAYAASIVFMSLGTMVYPGLGTTIGAILGDCTPLILGL